MSVSWTRYSHIQSLKATVSDTMSVVARFFLNVFHRLVSPIRGDAAGEIVGIVAMLKQDPRGVTTVLL